MCLLFWRENAFPFYLWLSAKTNSSCHQLDIFPFISGKRRMNTVDARARTIDNTILFSSFGSDESITNDGRTWLNCRKSNQIHSARVVNSWIDFISSTNFDLFFLHHFLEVLRKTYINFVFLVFRSLPLSLMPAHIHMMKNGNVLCTKHNISSLCVYFSHIFGCCCLMK